MATIALVSQYKDTSRRKKTLIVKGTLAGTYTVGGVTVDWTTTTNPKFISNGLVGSNPQHAEVINAPAGYSTELIAGTTLKNWLLKIYTAPGVELTAIAIPAALIADPLLFELTGPLGNF